MPARPGLACLRLAILAYRRRVSGRGPMRLVGCSFAECESCSAYGLRSVETAANALVALRSIRGRLRRCRELALYRMHEHERELLAWGRDYELDTQLAAALVEADELPLTRWTVLDAARQLAAYRGQWSLAQELEAQRNACLTQTPARAPRVLVRRGSRLLATLRLRLAVELALLAALAGMLCALVPLALAPLALVLPAIALLGLQSCFVTMRALQRQRRFARQIAAARFTTSQRALLSPVSRR